MLRIRRPSPALVVAVVALFAALGGTGYAAFRLPANSVTTKQVKDHSLRLKDFGRGQVPTGARGPIGPAGLNGSNGTNGQDGARGPSDGYLSAAAGPQDNSGTVSVTVPAGDYVAAASAEAFYFRSDSTYPTADSEATCSLTSAADAAHGVGTFATVPAHGYSNGTDRGGLATVSQNTAFHLPAGGTISYTCSTAPDATKDGSATQQYADMRVTAVQVGTLH